MSGTPFSPLAVGSTLLSEAVRSYEATLRDQERMLDLRKSRLWWRPQRWLVGHLERETLARAAWYAGALSVTAVLIPLALAALLGEAPAEKSTAAPAADGDLSGLGQIVGGVLAALIATITFVVQLYGSKSKLNTLLTPFALRAGLVYSACGVSVGAVFACNFVPFLHDWGAPIYRPALEVLGWAYGLLALALALCVLRIAVNARLAASPAILTFLPAEIAQTVARDRRFYEMYRVLKERLVGTRFKEGTGGLSVEWLSGGQVDIVPRVGKPLANVVITDISLQVLSDLDRLLAQHCPGARCRLFGMPGMRGDIAELSILIPAADASTSSGDEAPFSPPAGTQAAAASATDDWRAEAQLLCDQVWIMQRVDDRPSTTLNELFRDVAEDALSAVEAGRDGLKELREIIELMKEFSARWAKLWPEGSVSPWSNWSQSYQPSFQGPFAGRWSKVIKQAVTSGDVAVIEHVVSFLGSIRVVGSGNAHLEKESLDLMNYAYRVAAKRLEDPSVVGELIDNQTSYLGAAPMSNKDEPADPQKLASFTRDVAFALDLFKVAFEHGHQPDAEAFARRIRGQPLEFPRHRGYEDGEAACKHESMVTVHDYAMLAAVGWILRVVEDDPTKAALGSACLGKLRTAMPFPERAMGVWELYHRVNHWEPEIDRLLGVNRWDLERLERGRHFEPTTRMGGAGWIIDGVLAASLLANQGPIEPLFERCFGGTEGADPWPEALTKRLSEIAASTALKGAALEAGREGLVVKMIEYRQLQFQKTKLLAELSLLPSPEVIARHTQDLRSGLERRYTLVKRIIASGIATGVPPAGTPFHHKEGLDGDRNWLINFRSSPVPGKFIAKGIAARNTAQPLVLAERSCPATAPCAISEAKGCIEDAVVALKLREARSYDANILFVPDNTKLIEALYGETAWKVKQKAQQEGKALPDFAGMVAFLWPYSNPKGLLVADTRGLFVYSGSLAAGISVEIIMPPAAVDDKLKQQIAAAKSAPEMPQAIQMNVRLIGGADAPLAIADLEAGLFIPVEFKAKFAFDPETKTLHKGDCYLVDEENHRLASTIGGCVAGADWQGCQECKPDIQS